MNAQLDIEQTLVDLFEEACDKYADKPAFSCLNQTLTYRELHRLSENFAAYLQRYTDLEPGDRIAVQLPNLLQFPVVVYGALRAGLVVVNTNPLYTASEMEHQMKDSGAKALVVMSSMGDKALEVAKASSIKLLLLTAPGDFSLRVSDACDTDTDADGGIDARRSGITRVSLRDAIEAGRNCALKPTAVTPGQLSVLQYTGGTTGVSKGAMLTHRNLVANTKQVEKHSSEYFRPGEECYVAALPLYHIYAFTIHCVLLLHKGGHSLLIPNPRDISALVESIRPYRFTGFPGINTLFAALCRDDSFRSLDLSGLKSTSAGGMALSEEVASAWRELTGIQIAEGYGMSETSPVVSANPPGRIRSGTVGLPIPLTEVKVIDAQGRTLPAGERGELCVRGPQVMQGYWQRPQETAEVLSADGWLRTGDVAVIQPDGYIQLVDRIKDMIVVSGFNVYPNEVESVASMHPSVKECAVIGVPDSRAGEAVKLFVVPMNDDFDGEALRSFMRTRLTPYKMPTHIELMKDLPKSNVGKILRKALRSG